MKRFKIIACFLLIFSLAFSEEGSVLAEQKARITQLEQQIETQNKIIARYERLEDKLNDKLLASSSLNYNVDQFYNSKWDKLEKHLDRALNIFMWIIGGAFALIGFLIPFLQNRSMSRTLDKIENHEKKLEEYQKQIERQQEQLEIQEKSLNGSQKDLWKQNSSFQKHKKALRLYMANQKEIIDSQNKALEVQKKEVLKSKILIDKQQKVIEKDLEEHKQMNIKINNALSEAYYLNAQINYRTLEEADKDNFEVEMIKYVEWLCESIDYCLKGDSDNYTISWNLLNITDIFKVNKDNKLEFSEDRIKQLARNSVYSQLAYDDITKIKNNFSDFFAIKEIGWDEENKRRIAQVFEE